MAIKKVGSSYKVRVSYRYGDNCRHLRKTVRGTLSDAKAVEAKLYEQADKLKKGLPLVKDVNSSLKFRDALQKYMVSGVKVNSGLRSVFNRLNKELGNAPLIGFRNFYEAWLSDLSTRGLSEATIKKYKRYVKAIMRRSQMGCEVEGIVVGGIEARKRSITSVEIRKLMDACERVVPWFLTALKLCITSPIRPQDLFQLTRENVDANGDIKYMPRKTAKTGRIAFPIISADVREHVMSVKDGLLFKRPNGKPLYNKDSENNNHYYRFVWERIRKASGIKDVTLYDLRHYAVDRLLSQNVTDKVIEDIAGWCSSHMIRHYATGNEELIRKQQRELFNESTDESTNTG